MTLSQSIHTVLELFNKLSFIGIGFSYTISKYSKSDNFSIFAPVENLKPMKEYWRFIRFALFSASAGLIEIGAFALLNEITRWSYWPCYLIALLCSILWNFTLNRKFTFRSAANVPVAMMKVLGFYAVFTPATTILGSYLADTLMWNEYLVTGINMGLNFVTEYLFQRYVVYGTSLDTQK